MIYINTHTVKPNFFEEKKRAGHGKTVGKGGCEPEMLEHHRGRLRLENSNLGF